jgi:hypothetical protein
MFLFLLTSMTGGNQALSTPWLPHSFTSFSILSTWICLGNGSAPACCKLVGRRQSQYGGKLCWSSHVYYLSQVPGIQSLASLVVGLLWRWGSARRWTSPCLAVHWTIQSWSLTFWTFSRHHQCYRFVADHYVAFSLNLILKAHIYDSERDFLLSSKRHGYVQSLLWRCLRIRFH